MTQLGFEPGHPYTLYPDDVIRNTISHVGLPIYVVNEVLFIYHTLLTLHINVIYQVFHVHIRYILYIYIRYKICRTYTTSIFFQVTKPGFVPGHPCTLYPDDAICNTIGHVGLSKYVVNEVLFIYHTLLTLHIYVIYDIYNIHKRYILYIYKI